MSYGLCVRLCLIEPINWRQTEQLKIYPLFFYSDNRTDRYVESSIENNNCNKNRISSLKISTTKRQCLNIGAPRKVSNRNVKKIKQNLK